MPGRRLAAVPSPLSDAEVEELRTQVDRGGAPRVVVRSASAGLPAGSRGSVVRVGDPAAEDEFILVRLGGDEIPFAPGELALPGRRAVEPPRSPDPPVAARVAKRVPARKTPAPTRLPQPSAGGPAPAAAAAAPAAAAPASGAAAKAAPRKAVDARAAAKKPSRRRPPQPVALTLRFDGEAWTAEAARGGRRVGRPSPVRAGAVRALADLIDDPQVAGLVAETVDACRDEAARRTAELRAQLAAAEAALKEYE